MIIVLVNDVLLKKFKQPKPHFDEMNVALELPFFCVFWRIGKFWKDTFIQA